MMREDTTSGSITTSLPGKLAHEFLAAPVPESPKSAPSVLEMPQHSIVSTSSSISRDDNLPPPDITQGGDDSSSPSKESRYPSCVSTSRFFDDARTHSPLSTLTPEQLSIRHKQDGQHNATAIDLSLRFLSGIPPAKTGPEKSPSLMPGIFYQNFDDYAHPNTLLPSICNAPKSTAKSSHHQIHYLAMRPQAMPNSQRRLLGMKADRLSNIDPSEEESTIQDIDDIDVSFMSACSLHEKIPIEPNTMSVSEVISHQIEGVESLLDPNGKHDEVGDDDDDEDVYVCFEQGEEHTLCDFEDKVANMGDAESEEESYATGAPHDFWLDDVLQPEFRDPTGLLNVMDRMLDCLDPQLLIQSEGRGLDSSPQTYDEKTLDDDLEWEAAMEKDGMDWLFPCCDDSGLDKDFGNFLDDSSTEAASLPDSVSAIENVVDTSLNDNSAASKDVVADRTMVTETDLTLELSLDA